MTLAVVVFFAALIGVSMGFSGIGGFLVVPLMMIVADATATQAVFTALAANLGATLANGLLAIGKSQVDWRAFGLMLTGSLAGALLGAWLVGVLSPAAGRTIIAVFLVVLGLATLFARPSRTDRRDGDLPAAGAIGLGVVAQVTAVLVGIGGPAITVPVLASRIGSANRVVGTALLHGAFVSALGILVARKGGAALGTVVLLVPAVVVVASLLASVARTRILAAVSLRPFVGAMALVGAVVLWFAR